MISAALTALLALKEAGGTRTVIGQTSTDSIMGDSTTLMRTESIGARFEDITIH